MSSGRSASMDNAFQMPEPLNIQPFTLRGGNDSLDKKRSARPAWPKRDKSGLSEASITKPESTKIAAEGKFPALGNRSTSVHNFPTRHDGNRSSRAASISAEKKVNDKTSPPPQDSPSDSNKAEEHTSASTQDQTATSASASRSGDDDASKHDAKRESKRPENDGREAEPSATTELPPQIQIQPPSKAASPLHSSDLPSDITAPTSTPAVPSATPGTSNIGKVSEPASEALKSLPAKAASDTTLVNNLPLPERLTPDIPQLKSPAQLPVGLPVQSSRRARAVRKVRKLVIRRTVLKLLLGKELGTTTHSQLRNGQSISGTASLPAGL